MPTLFFEMPTSSPKHYGELIIIHWHNSVWSKVGVSNLNLIFEYILKYLAEYTLKYLAELILELLSEFVLRVHASTPRWGLVRRQIWKLWENRLHEVGFMRLRRAWCKRLWLWLITVRNAFEIAVSDIVQYTLALACGWLPLRGLASLLRRLRLAAGML